MALFLCISSCSLNNKIAHCCFSIDKTKNKKNMSCIAVFGCVTGNRLAFLLGLMSIVFGVCFFLNGYYNFLKFVYFLYMFKSD